MNKIWRLKRFAWTILAILLVSLTFFGCSAGQDSNSGTDFDGLGQGHVTSVSRVIKGEVKFNGFGGGEIIVEARQSFPCPYGRCPVIEKEPLGFERLSQPGPYTLSLLKSVDELIIIANYFDDSGATRIAHKTVSGEEKIVENIDLSLDRPYPPLR